MTSIVKVNQIQDGGGNAIITSDGSGNITTQNVLANTPAFIAYNSADQSISNTTYTVYQYNTKVLDTDNAFNTSTYTYTVPSAGKYVIGGGAKIKFR